MHLTYLSGIPNAILILVMRQCHVVPFVQSYLCLNRAQNKTNVQMIWTKAKPILLLFHVL